MAEQEGADGQRVGIVKKDLESFGSVRIRRVCQGTFGAVNEALK